jgi:hypothetical protein
MRIRSAETAAPAVSAASHCRYTERMRAAWPNASRDCTRSSITEGRREPVAVKMRMKVAIQGDTNALVVPCDREDVGIFRPCHADLRDVHHIEALLAQQGCRTRGKTLIQQDPFHAT